MARKLHGIERLDLVDDHNLLADALARVSGDMRSM